MQIVKINSGEDIKKQVVDSHTANDCKLMVFQAAEEQLVWKVIEIFSAYHSLLKELKTYLAIW